MPVSAPTSSEAADHHHSHGPFAGHGPADSGPPMEVPALEQLDHVAVGSARSILKSIQGPAINLAIWQRRIPEDIADAIDAAGPDSFAYVDDRFDAGEGAAVLASWLETSRLSGPLGSWLVRDIEALVEETARLGGAARVRLKIETLTNTKCSRFHCDMTLVRLISAYHGAGTEFVADSIADDVFLRDMLPPPRQIMSAHPESVCVLRGAQPAEGFAERAIVHRSPDIHRTEDWRLLVTIDALAE